MAGLIPALHRPGADPHQRTGLCLSGTRTLRLGDQGEDVGSFRIHRELSSFPQIAVTFFWSTNKAAVSARALSLRISSLVSSLFSCLSVFTSADILVLALTASPCAKSRRHCWKI